jgi:hypothetical protein
MFENVIIKYFHPGLNVGIQDIRNVWLLEKEPVKLITTLHQVNLVFRIPGSRKRISYLTLKKGLVKKKIIIQRPLYLLPF